MNEDKEFQETGRKLPFKVPVGFFEHISEKTLLKAKQREQSSRKLLIVLRTFALAASFSAIALLGYYITETEKPEIKQEVQNKQTEIIDTIQPTKVITKQITIAEIKKVTPAKTIVKETQPEEITDVLAEMSDDELLQLAALYQSDPFIEESQP